MRKIILYVACSLDGKIADREGNVDWLDTIPNPDHSDYGYSDFIKSVDTTLMGNKTYQQVLGFDVPFPYKETKNYVITRDGTLTNDENVEYIHQNIADFISDLKNKAILHISRFSSKAGSPLVIYLPLLHHNLNVFN